MTWEEAVEYALGKKSARLKTLKNRRQPRTVRLVLPLQDDLRAWRSAGGSLDEGDPVFPSRGGIFWRASDWNNWRKRVFGPAARAAGFKGFVHMTFGTRAHRSSSTKVG